MRKANPSIAVILVILVIATIIASLFFSSILTGNVTSKVINLQENRSAEPDIFIEAEKDPQYAQLQRIFEQKTPLDLLVAAKTPEEIENAGQEFQKWIYEMENEKAYEWVKRITENKEIFPSAIQSYLPEKVLLANKIVRIEHGDKYENGKLLETYYKLFVRGKTESMKDEWEVHLVGNPRYLQLLDNYQGYRVGKSVYIDVLQDRIEESVTLSEGNDFHEKLVTSQQEKLELQVFPSPAPYNQVTRNVLVLIPYNSANPLPANYAAFVNAQLNAVQQYYLANSENLMQLNFTLYPFVDPFYNPTTQYFNPLEQVLIQLDPQINYANYDFAYHLVYFPGGGGGYAGFNMSGNTPIPFATNEPIASIRATSFFDPAIPDPQFYTAFVIEHEIGHSITYFNPQFSIIPFGTYFAAILPHAHGIDPNSNGCIPTGPIIICTAEEYGDQIDVMGTGRGIFTQHNATYLAGLRSISRTQSITTNGTYTLCDIQHTPPANCPQELFFPNMNGVNVSVELRTPVGPDAFYTANGCPASYFDGVFVRATDLEDLGGIGNTIFSVNNIQVFGGSVLIPASPTSGVNCPNFTAQNYLVDYPLLAGQSMTTGLNTITLQSLTPLANGGKQATILVTNSITPPCQYFPPTISLTNSQLRFYSNNLLPVSEVNPYSILFTAYDICNTLGPNNPTNYTINFTTTIAGVLHTASIQFSSYGSYNNMTVDLPIPPSLAGITGTYTFTVTVYRTSTPTQSVSANGMITLENYSPQIYGPYGVSFCQDQDPILPFNLTDLGADIFSQYPNIGAIVALNPPIPNYPPVAYIGDLCPQTVTGSGGILVTDVVCGNNTGFAGLNTSAFLVVKDCRMEPNPNHGGQPYSGSTCLVGTCR